MFGGRIIHENKMKVYRQALRDLPVTSRPTLDEDGNILNVDWPTPPQ
jgi:hypothetical protein